MWPWLWQGSVSDIGREVETLFMDLLWLLIPIGIVAVVYLVTAVLRFRHRAGARAEPSSGGPLGQLVWAALAFALAYLIVSPSLAMWADVRGPGSGPDTTMEIRFVVDDDGWVATYPGTDGTLGTADDFEQRDSLTLAVDQPVTLHIESDELRTLSMRLFRIKREIPPRRTTSVWFEPDIVGMYPLGCDVSCETGYRMIPGRLNIIGLDRFRVWVDELSLAALGQLPYDPSN